MGFALPVIPSPPTRCAPAPAMLLLRAGLASDSLCGLSAVLRTSFIGRSLVSRIWPYRVRCVSRHWTHQFYGLTVHFQLLSTSPQGDAVTFRYWRLAPPERDFHPLAQAPSQAHERGTSRAPLQGCTIFWPTWSFTLSKSGEIRQSGGQSE